ncbi:unnamed protein product [Pylaiella littoralis]
MMQVQHHQRRRGAVIFLHGSGDTGRGVREWLASASAGKFERALADLGLGPVVYPTAAERRYTLGGGLPSTVWFDRERLNPGSRQDRAGVLRSLRQVEEEVEKLEEAGVPRSGVFVGVSCLAVPCPPPAHPGFSMGGCLALEVLGSERLAGRIAGVFSHASFLNNDSAVFETAQAPPTPVYASHGGADGMVSVTWGRATVERLKTKGFDIELKEHNELDHELGGEQIRGLLEWISAIVARPGFGHSTTVGEAAGEGGDGRNPSPVRGEPQARTSEEALHASQVVATAAAAVVFSTLKRPAFTSSSCGCCRIYCASTLPRSTESTFFSVVGSRTCVLRDVRDNRTGWVPVQRLFRRPPWKRGASERGEHLRERSFLPA